MSQSATELQERTDERIRKRAAFESFSFEVPEPGRVIITNHSWGNEAHQHCYTVTVEEGEAVACSCPFFEHREQTCKHILASQAQPAVITAASMTPDPNGEAGAQSGGASESQTDECENGQPGCPGPDSDVLGCFDCFSVLGVR